MSRVQRMLGAGLLLGLSTHAAAAPQQVPPIAADLFIGLVRQIGSTSPGPPERNMLPIFFEAGLFIPENSDEQVYVDLLRELADRAPKAEIFFAPTGAMIGDTYRAILLRGEPIRAETVAAQERLKAAEILLFNHGDPKRGPSKAYSQYLRYKKSYEDAQANLSDASPETADRTSLETSVSQQRLAWESLGRKNEIESALALIQQLSPSSWWAILREDVRREFPEGGPSHPPISLLPLPSDWFADSDWVQIRSRAADPSNRAQRLPRGMPGDAWIPWAATSSDGNPISFAPRTVDIKLELKLVQIQRDWLDPLIFRARWKWTDDSKTVVSSGGMAPDGILPCIPAFFLLARNVVIAISPLDKTQRAQLAAIASKGRLRWAGLSLADLQDGDRYRPELSKSSVRQPFTQLVGVLCDPVQAAPSTISQSH